MNYNKIKYDYIIIGAGISGLYTAYNIKKKSNKTFIILEANDFIGGRTLEEKFNNQLIKTGAGIVRITDKLLI
jgi:monoamine oxidase